MRKLHRTDHNQTFSSSRACERVAEDDPLMFSYIYCNKTILRSYDSRIRAYARRRFEQISVKPFKCYADMERVLQNVPFRIYRKRNLSRRHEPSGGA